MYKRLKIVARLPASDGSLLLVRHEDVGETVMLPPTTNEPWGLRITHRKGVDSEIPWWRYAPEDRERTDIRGNAAIHAAAQLLPRVNQAGARARDVQAAVALAARHNDPVTSFEAAARVAAKTWSWNDFGKRGRLAKLDPELRLALEMISHEDSERRALEGELHLLEEAWRDAEEIAGISDNLFLPSDVSTRLAQMKGRVE